MTLLEQLSLPHTLKRIERKGMNGKRHETTAEHTYSTIFLAEYFLKKHTHLDKNKVMQIILYHDFVEIYAGDTFAESEKDKIRKEKLEEKAYQKLLKTLPKEIATDFEWAWKEYESQKTQESRFAKAMDALDPIIHEINEKEDWKKYHFTESKLRKYKEPILKEFPLLMDFFNTTIKELKNKKIIPKE